jgi:hypothetical protein
MEQFNDHLPQGASCVNPCAACVTLYTALGVRGREQFLVQLHTKNGDEHLYMAHSYAVDKETGPPHWHDAMLQLFDGTNTEFQADVIKELCRVKLTEGYAIHHCLPDEDDAMEDGQQKSDTPMSLISRYFHMRIEHAATRLRICPTVLKKICRRHGIHRWPYRQVNAIHRRLQEVVAEGNVATE